MVPAEVRMALDKQIEAGEAHRVERRRIGLRHLLDAVHDRLGARQRRGVGQDRGGDVIALVLGRHEAARDDALQADDRQDHDAEHRQRQPGALHHPAHAVGVAPVTRANQALKRSKNG
jgi:hypothetical protein